MRQPDCHTTKTNSTKGKLKMKQKIIKKTKDILISASWLLMLIATKID